MQMCVKAPIHSVTQYIKVNEFSCGYKLMAISIIVRGNHTHFLQETLL